LSEPKNAGETACATTTISDWRMRVGQAFSLPDAFEFAAD